MPTVDLEVPAQRLTGVAPTHAVRAEHLEGPLYRSMAGYLAEAGMTGAEVDKYRVIQKQPVYDGSGVPQAAFD